MSLYVVYNHPVIPSIEKQIKNITSKEKEEEIQMTEKQPNKESAMIAARTGSRLVEPLTMFPILVATMLFT